MTDRIGRRPDFPVGIVGLPILLLCCIAYYAYFATDVRTYDGGSGLFQQAINLHDHEVYLSAIELVRQGEVAYEFSNDLGIALVYHYISLLLPSTSDPDFTRISLFFNCFVLCLCYFFHSHICRRLGLGASGKATFFVNTSFLYFSQLINKDLLTILVFLIAIDCGLNRRLRVLILLIPLAALIRQQLVVFLIIFVALMPPGRMWPRLVLFYIVTSVSAGILSVFASIIGEESLGSGLSAFIVNFNRDYYVGYLIFNPIRVVQFLFDAYASFNIWNDGGGIDTARLLRLPQLILLAVLSPYLFRVFYYFKYWMHTPARPLITCIVAYLLTWLMNPTINARYVMLITPVLILCSLYARRMTRKSVR